MYTVNCHHQSSSDDRFLLRQEVSSCLHKKFDCSAGYLHLHPNSEVCVCAQKRTAKVDLCQSGLIKVTWNPDYVMHIKYSSFHRQFFQVFTIEPRLYHLEYWLAGGIGICRHY